MNIFDNDCSFRYLMLTEIYFADCEYSGETYPHGDNFQTDGDCHNCTCEFGSVQCTGNKVCCKFVVPLLT